MILRMLMLLMVATVGQINADYAYPQTCGVYQNCCYPPQDCCGKGFISADLLYWRAFQSGLGVCVSSELVEDVESDGTVISSFSGKSRSPHYNWEPGYRIGAGYQFGGSPWEVALYFTDFHSHSNKHNGDNDDDDFLNDERHFKWHLNYYVTDLLLGYDYEYSCYFSLKPFVGVRYAQIELSSKFFEFDSLLLTSADSHNKQKFNGVGPIFGLEGDWNLGCGFGLYANGAISGLYGNYRNSSHEANVFEDSEEFTDFNDRRHNWQTVVDLGVGVSWEECFCDGLKLIVKLGWEHHQYFNIDRCDCGDLSLDGGVLSARVDF